MAASRPTRKTRKFDVHACFAGMNIKFPALLGRWLVPHHTSWTARASLGQISEDQ
jgi:hypothetical protein